MFAIDISIHAPREGGDPMQVRMLKHGMNFNPRPPRGGRRRRFAVPSCSKTFQSTPPARGATFFLKYVGWPGVISIHAPREGGDSKDAQFYLRIFDK